MKTLIILATVSFTIFGISVYRGSRKPHAVVAKLSPEFYSGGTKSTDVPAADTPGEPVVLEERAEEDGLATLSFASFKLFEKQAARQQD